MKVLITGREGQLVRSLLERGGGVDGLELIAVGRPELDLARPETIRNAVRRHAPDVIVSAAAYTAVDQAEDEPELAFRVNGQAPGLLADAAREFGGRIIHFSTDYVFDGSASEPYREDAGTGPIGVYGQSKLQGEERVQVAGPDHVIVRTAWVYSPFGRNFVKTMMSLAKSRDVVRVVADQCGSPSSALDLADGVLAILRGWASGGRAGLGETFHLAGTGEASWYDLAAEVFSACTRRGLPSAKAEPISTADYPTKAVRPANSMLDSAKFAATFGYRAPHWRGSVGATVKHLAKDRP
jgi:dTDP-4-dehydrorhamnose reductase